LAIVNELDRAFIAELREVVRRATEAFEEYEFAQALEITESFFWSGFTDNYIELVKARARSEADPAGRASAVATLRLGLSTFLRLFAPFVPNICDEVWSWAFAAETGVPSVHTALWPADSSPLPLREGISPSSPLSLRERVRVRGTESPLPAGDPSTSSGRQGEGEGEALPTSHDLSTVAPPANPASFQAACDAIAAVRKAKTEAGISLGAPLSRLDLVSDQSGIDTLRPVLDDVLSASGTRAANLLANGATPDARYIATVSPA
jgi:valyl-tRNA synthetase